MFLIGLNQRKYVTKTFIGVDPQKDDEERPRTV